MSTRKNTKRRKTHRRKTRRKKGGDKLEYIKNQVTGFKNNIKKMKDFKTNAIIAKNLKGLLTKFKGKGIKNAQNVISKIKTTEKKITPCTVAAIADRISCSTKYLHTTDPSNTSSPKWFVEPPKHSRFLKTMCQNSQNIHNTLNPGNFDYFKPGYLSDEGCQRRTEDKLMETSKKIDRDNSMKADKNYLKLSPEEKRRMNETEEKLKKEDGINLVPLEQRDHLLAGQKHKPGERKGRGKKKHLSKQVKKRRKEKKKAEKEFYNRMIQPVPGTNSPVLSVGPEGMVGKEKSCAEILEDGQGYTTSSYAKWEKCNNKAKAKEKLIVENQKRRAERKYTQRREIQTRKKSRKEKKNKKEFTQQISIGGKRKRKTKRKSKRRRKRKTKRRR